MRGIGMERICSLCCRVLVQVTETKPNERNNWNQIVLSYVEGQNVLQKKDTNWTSERM